MLPLDHRGGHVQAEMLGIYDYIDRTYINVVRGRGCRQAVMPRYPAQLQNLYEVKLKSHIILTM